MARPSRDGRALSIEESGRSRKGADLAKEAAFEFAFRYLKLRISEFADLPLHDIDNLSLGARRISRLDGATHLQPKAD